MLIGGLGRVILVRPKKKAIFIGEIGAQKRDKVTKVTP